MTSDRPSPPVQPRNTGSQHVELYPGLPDTQLAVFNSAPVRPDRMRVLVLKLDHLGDFLIGLPALRQLRATLPQAHITLVCGSWNAAAARSLGVVDEVLPYDYFPQNAQDWDGKVAADAIDRFRKICTGRFDVAVDLRVDEDTRPLLRHIDAAVRCGIGSRRRQPYLNIILPSEFEGREVRPIGTDTITLGPKAFESRMPVQTPFYHETDFSFTDNHLIYGPYCLLPLGRLRAELAFQLIAPFFSLPRVNVRVEVARDDFSEIVTFNRLRDVRRTVTSLLDVTFVNDNSQARYEFRVSVGGQPRGARLRFLGMRVQVLEAPPQGARFIPAELHVGESLSLLVRLIAERLQPLYAPGLRSQLANGDDVGAARPAGVSDTARCIVVAPFSNSKLRNWSLDRYAALVAMLLAKVDCYVVLVGSGEQARDIERIREPLADRRRAVNLAGEVDWPGLAAVVGRADLVIANNSGVVHLAAACGAPTLAIYSGSHQPQEWGPRGPSVRVLMAAVPCSPCGHDKLEACPHGQLCMTLIEPETVFRHALELLDGAAPLPKIAADPSPTLPVRAGNGEAAY